LFAWQSLSEMAVDGVPAIQGGRESTKEEK
jgi:hypothetical protein